MESIDRRAALKRLTSLPLAVGFGLGASETLQAAAHASRAMLAASKGVVYRAKFFTAHEWESVRILVDLIIPKDQRSGSATDAGVPEFMDFLMTDPVETDRGRELRQTAMRGGLAWIDAECVKRYGRDFASASEGERRGLLDEISHWNAEEEDEAQDPREMRPLLRHGPSFFASFRDLTASGFWSSRMGVEDLAYQGNTYVAEWKGCPPEVLRKLGLEG